jgi:transcriptional regulator with XRE-family HTH domain
MIVKFRAFHKELKIFRLSKRLSQRELAKLSGTTPACICQLENGSRKPTLDTAKKIANALSISVDELFNQKELDQLKNCPFCNKQPECLSHTELFLRTNPSVPLRYGIFCDCQLFFETPEEAIEAWNKRI